MVIFVCGVVTGALVIKTLGPSASRQERPGPPPGIPGPRPVIEIIHRMAQAHIDLTPDQTNQIVKIMQDSQATNAAIRKVYFPLLQTEAKRAHDAISQVLTLEQRPLFAAMLEERPQGRGGRGDGAYRGRTNRAPGGSNWNFDDHSRDNRDRHNPPIIDVTNGVTNTP